MVTHKWSPEYGTCLLTLLTCSVSPTLCFVIGTLKNTIMTELFMDREMNYWYQFKMNLAADWCMDMKQRHSSNLNHHSPTDWFLSRNDLDAEERYKVHLSDFWEQVEHNTGSWSVINQRGINLRTGWRLFKMMGLRNGTFARYSALRAGSSNPSCEWVYHYSAPGIKSIKYRIQSILQQ